MPWKNVNNISIFNVNDNDITKLNIYVNATHENAHGNDDDESAVNVFYSERDEDDNTADNNNNLFNYKLPRRRMLTP